MTVNRYCVIATIGSIAIREIHMKEKLKEQFFLVYMHFMSQRSWLERHYLLL